MASRKEEKARLRQEREERERAAAASQGRNKRIGYVIAGALIAAVVIALVVVVSPFGGDGGGGGGEAEASVYPDGGKVPAPAESDLDAAVKAAGCEVRNDKNTGSSHTEGPVQYKDNPPTSGDHNPIPAEDSIYPRQPKIENLVHTLEHGRIVIQFKPNAPAPLRANLKALYDEDPAHVVLTPNDTLEAQVAATAWTKALLCPRPNDKMFDAIRAFKDRYRDRGPEFVP